ncbi:hypothetical protein, partial [Salmonella enterica]|uniref:hypothetical protein n=1 Tax=Salmonella enterica TaxID=28901 RepID=UPI001C392857
NKSKGVLITGLKLKAFRNPQPSWGFSIDNKNGDLTSPFLLLVFERLSKLYQNSLNSDRNSSSSFTPIVMIT